MSIADSVRGQIPPIHPEGYPFIGAFALASLILFWVWSPLGWIGTVLTLWCTYFFRDPVRVTPVRDGLVVSPADGRISLVTNAVPPKELDLGERPLPRVSVFMSVFDCHVNRSPVAGRVERIVYRAGKFFNADLDKASEDNERNGLVVAAWRLPPGIAIFRSCCFHRLTPIALRPAGAVFAPFRCASWRRTSSRCSRFAPG